MPKNGSDSQPIVPLGSGDIAVLTPTAIVLTHSDYRTRENEGILQLVDDNERAGAPWLRLREQDHQPQQSASPGGPVPWAALIRLRPGNPIRCLSLLTRSLYKPRWLRCWPNKPVYESESLLDRLPGAKRLGSRRMRDAGASHSACSRAAADSFG